MKLLFICTHNRCRSILAEAITNHLANGKIIAASAGSSPAGEVHPLSLKFLAEHSISTENLTSQSWGEFEDFQPDVILTMCDSAAAEKCPVWFNKSGQVHWGLEDPSKKSGSEAELRESFNVTIDVIKRRVQALLDEDLDSLKGAALKDKLVLIAQQVN